MPLEKESVDHKVCEVSQLHTYSALWRKKTQFVGHIEVPSKLLITLTVSQGVKDPDVSSYKKVLKKSPKYLSYSKLTLFLSIERFKYVIYKFLCGEINHFIDRKILL